MKEPAKDAVGLPERGHLGFGFTGKQMKRPAYAFTPLYFRGSPCRHASDLHHLLCRRDRVETAEAAHHHAGAVRQDLVPVNTDGIDPVMQATGV